jgi:PAS domain S-box-containing protein
MLAGNSSNSPVPGDRSPERARGFWRAMSIAVRLSIGFIFAAAVPLLVGGILSLYTLQYASTAAIQQSEASLSALGEASISQVAEATAHQVELYLSMHPEIDLTNMAQLEKNAALAKIAVQPVGKTGYTAVFDNKGFTHFHSNPSMVGKDMSTLAGELPEFWAIFSAALDGSPSKGYYQWKDADGKIRSKYMSIVPVGNTPLRVAATTYMDEFSQPVLGLRTHLADVQKTASLRLLLILGVTVLASFAGALILGRQVSRPIRQVTDAATRLAAGDLSVRAPVTSGDEVGNLAASFNQMADQVGGLLQSLRAKNIEAEKRTAQLEANQRAIQVIFSASGSSKTDELLGLVVNLIRDRFNLYHVQMYLVDDQQQAAVLRQSTGYAGQQLLMKKHQIPLERTSLVTKVIHEGAPVLVEDVRQDPSFLANPLLPDTCSELAVPLKVGDKVVGVLDAQSREAGFFTPDMVALFETMTNQVGLLFKNSELFTRITLQSESLSLFASQLNTAAQVARRLGSILDPERLMSEVVELLQSRFGLYHVHVYVLDQAAQDLVVRAGSGEVGRVLRERGHKIALQADKSLIARAARSRQTVVVNDASLESDFMPNPLLPQTRSEMAVPLIAGDQVLGVLDVQDDEVNRFSQSEVDVFGTLAGQVATALQNAQLFEARKQAEEAVRESRQLLQIVMDNIPQAIFWKDRNLSYLGCNRAFAADAGMALAQDIIGKTDWDMPWKEQAELYRADDTRVMESGASKLDYEEPQTTPDGTIIWLRTSKVPLRDADGNVTAVLGMYEDITERKQAEEAVRESRARFQGLVETLSDWIWEVDQNGTYTYVSPKVKDLLGYEPEEVLGKTPFDLMPPEEAQRVAGVFGPLLSTQQPLVALENTNLHKDGHLVVLETSGVPFFDAQGQFKGYRGTDRDITARNRAEEELRASRQLLLNIIDFLPDATFVIDKDKKVIAWNRAIEEMSGARKEDILGQGDYAYALPFWGERRPIIIDLIGVEDPEFESKYEYVERKGNTLYAEVFVQSMFGGRGADVWVTASPLLDSHGNQVGAIESIREITQRKQAEAEIRTSEQRQRQILEASPIPTVLSRISDGTMIYANQGIAELTGLDLDQVIGRRTPDFYNDPEDRKRVLTMLREQGFVRNEDVLLKRADGSPFPAWLSMTPITFGGEACALSTVLDITERKRAEELIQKRAAELQTVAKVGTAASTILETDRLLQTVVDLTQSNFHLYHAHIYLLSKAADALVLAAGAGQVGQQMVAEGWRIPLNREQSLVAQAARTRQGVIVNDVRAELDFMPNPLLPDTRSELAVPLIAGDKVLGVLDVQSDQVGRFTKEDVAIQTTLASQIATALENARLFEETQHIAERLREVDRLKTEFLANMSHELRTPLNSIIGYAEVLLMGIDGTMEPETHEDVQAIFDNGHHLLSLINDILDLAKIEAGRMTLQPEEVDVAQLVDEVKSNSLGLLHKTKKPVELSVNIEGDVKPVWADRLRINQVLNNLVSNAVKFTDQGSISLRVFSENGWVCIQVQDTGCGISEADLSKLFEKFRQVDGSHKRRAEGTGLGLAITRYLVEMHGGTISVQSRLGEGSVFTVRLPAATQPESILTSNN